MYNKYDESNGNQQNHRVVICYKLSNFMALTISLSIRQDIYWIVSERREN